MAISFIQVSPSSKENRINHNNAFVLKHWGDTHKLFQHHLMLCHSILVEHLTHYPNTDVSEQFSKQKTSKFNQSAMHKCFLSEPCSTEGGPLINHL